MNLIKISNKKIYFTLEIHRKSYWEGVLGVIYHKDNVFYGFRKRKLRIDGYSNQFYFFPFVIVYVNKSSIKDYEKQVKELGAENG